MNKVKPTDFAHALSNYFFEYLPVQKGLSEIRSSPIGIRCLVFWILRKGTPSET
jgi:hypothetical protein